jgi:Sec-independent protein translocase protein TatA
MGCSTCKKSNTATMNPEDVDTVKLLPDNLYDGTFFFKLIAFFVILIAIPFILIVLVVQLFLTLFLPKKLPSASKKFKDFLMGIFSKYAEFKVKRTLKKRERQFKNTTEYVNKDIEEVEIYDNEE